MVLVVTILAALLAAAAVALYLQISATRAAGISGHTRGSLYCAEAGLAAARPLIADQATSWADLLNGTATYPWYPITGDIDDPADGVPDFVVTIRDNDDEFPANPAVDADQRIFIVSSCTKYANSPREVLELVSRAVTAGHHYADQAGGDESNAGFVGAP
jgi:hypothetical protein